MKIFRLVLKEVWILTMKLGLYIFHFVRAVPETINERGKGGNECQKMCPGVQLLGESW